MIKVKMIECHGYFDDSVRLSSEILTEIILPKKSDESRGYCNSRDLLVSFSNHFALKLFCH